MKSFFLIISISFHILYSIYSLPTFSYSFPISSPISSPIVCAPYTAFGGKLPNLSFVNGNPFFSWDHIPVFAHTGRTTGLTDAEKQYFATHPFSTVTIPKFEGILTNPANLEAETKITKTARDIMSFNPHANIMFYLSIIEDFQNYNLHCTIKANRADLTDKLKKFVTLNTLTPVPIVNCSPLKVIGMVSYVDCFDHTKPVTLRILSNFSDEIMNTRAFKGFFLDRSQENAEILTKTNPSWKLISVRKQNRWNVGHRNAIAFMGYYNSPQLTIANGLEIDAINGKKIGYMFEQMQFDFTGLSFYEVVLKLQRMGGEGRVIQVNAKPCGPDSVGEILLGNAKAKMSSKSIRAITMSGFLIGACKYSYYSCNGGFVSDKPNSLQTCWHKEYNQLLGPPLGKAFQIKIRNTYVFYRSFGHGVNVYLQILSDTTQYFANACICWNDSTELCSDGLYCKNMTSLYNFSSVKLVDDGCK